MLRKLFSHTFWYAIGPQVPKFVNILVLPFVTPFLSAIDYGVFGTIGAYIGLLSGLQMLGMPVVFVNSFYQYPHSERWKIKWRQFMGFLMLWSVIYAILVAVLLYFFIPEEANEYRNRIIILLSIQSAFYLVIKNIGGQYYQLREKPKYIALITIVTGVITVVLNYTFIAVFKLGYMGWYYSGFITGFVSLLLFAYPLFRIHKLTPIFNFKIRLIKKSLKVSLPTVPHNYSNYLLNSSDRMVLDRLNVNISSIGLYNVGYVFGNYFDLIGSAVGMAVGPILAKLWAKKKLYEYRLVIFILQTLFISGAFLLCIWVKELLPILYRNKSLDGAYLFAVFIVMGCTYRPMYWAVISKLMFEEKTKKLWRISFVGGLLNIILNLIFIPIYGVMAAPVTTLISLLYLGFSGYGLKTYKNFNDLNHYPLLWLVLILVFTFLAYHIVDFSLENKLLISGVVLLAMVILYFTFKRRIRAIII